ncbi:DnaD domain protein [Lacticaseibacillus paracasei]|uniref:DnaD domain protein n=2 Tax=Lacticaseibacillus paracasei TaxID=1597 RepID=UPI00058B3E5A|nr:DnaD domain protein [Lacticaseibacillus paracasei]ALX87755.1 DNA replication protein DnaD [Lacticaseibacillus paracasei]
MNSYFPHDSNARNDAKILKVRMKYGAEGYGVYFMLLERLRDDSEYMSVKDYNMIAFDLRVDASLIKDIVENFGLFAFADNGECFYSESFNKRMLIKDEVSNKRAAAGKKGAAKRWNGKAIAKPSSENSKDIAKPQEDDGNKSKVKESKVNKTKRQQTTAPVKAAERPAEEPSSSSSSILDICNFWEGNGFGQLSPFTRESLVDWVDDMRKAGSPEPEKLVLNALRTAVESNVRNYKYVNGILKNWESKRLLTVTAVEANDSERKTNQPQRRYGKPERVDKEPDWLKPGYQEPKHEVTPEQRAKLAEQLEQLNKLGEKN